MLIHQALFGDKAGSYALIGTSLELAQAKRLCNTTDLVDRPSAEGLAEPVIRGFAFHNYYLFIKSFPDDDPGVRKGRVLSHALVLNLEQIGSLNDICSVTERFHEFPRKENILEPIEVSSAVVKTRLGDGPTREAFAINRLLEHSDYSNVIAWTGESGYWQFLRQVWSQLNADQRSGLRIGVAFNPQRIDTEKLSLIYVPIDYEGKWRAADCCIVGQHEREAPNSVAARLLAGEEEGCESLRRFISDFEVAAAAIEDLRYLEAGAAIYRNLSKGTEILKTIILCDLVSKYCPDQTIASGKKQALIAILRSQIPIANADQILKLRNADWAGFLDAKEDIGLEITAWMASACDSPAGSRLPARLIATALISEARLGWWGDWFQKGLRNVLDVWKPDYAVLIWAWFSEYTGLVSALEAYIKPTAKVEADFVRTMPKLTAELANAIVQLSAARNWLTLHGLAAVQLFDTSEAFRRQLEVDEEPSSYDALRAMSDAVNSKELLRVAVELDDARVVHIASEQLIAAPSLINALDVTSRVCRQIWLLAIDRGLHPYKRLRRPETTLFLLLDEMLAGRDVEPKLVVALAKSGLSDLTRYPNRARLWTVLDDDARQAFLEGTALAYVRRIDSGEMEIHDLEIELRQQTSKGATIGKICRDSSISQSTKILVFEELDNTREGDFLELVRATQFSAQESVRVGKLIQDRRWRNAAKEVGDLVTSRTDLKHALLECDSLLSFVQRMRLLYAGYVKGVSADEWWSTLLRECCYKYPRGPTDKGLWSRAGGDEADLQAFGSGREIWIDLIDKIKSGYVTVSVRTLLAVMREDFPHSSDLKYLQRTE